MPDRQADRLVYHAVQNEQDAARFIALNDAVTGEGPICARLLHHRPRTYWSDFTLVEDLQSGEVISSTCLLPWQCQLEGVTLEAAMLEMVVTDPRYRQRGLVRTQIEHFQHEVAARGFDFSIIQGIPYYYRQFGYGYALDHTRCDLLPAGSLPEAIDEAAAAYRLRDAVLADVPELAALYDQSMREYPFFVLRSPEDWRYLLEHAGRRVQVLEAAAGGRLDGYTSLRVLGETDVLLGESAARDRETGLALLGLLAGAHPGNLRIAGPAEHLLVKLAREFGSQAQPAEQWLVQIHDPAAFLKKIGTVLEARLIRSGMAGLTASLTLNFFRRALRLVFESGKLAQVEPVGFVDSSMGARCGDLCIPPDAFLRLAFGFRGLDQLVDAWPDIYVSPETRPIWDALFPRFEAWVLMPY